MSWTGQGSAIGGLGESSSEWKESKHMNSAIQWENSASRVDLERLTLTRIDLVNCRGSVILIVALILIAREASRAGVQWVVGQQLVGSSASSASAGEFPFSVNGSTATMPTHVVMSRRPGG